MRWAITQFLLVLGNLLSSSFCDDAAEESAEEFSYKQCRRRFEEKVELERKIENGEITSAAEPNTEDAISTSSTSPLEEPDVLFDDNGFPLINMRKARFMEDNLGWGHASMIEANYGGALKSDGEESSNMGKAIKKLLKAKEAKPKARPVYGFWNPYEPEWLQQKNLETQRDMIAGEDATTTADGGTRAEESGTQYMRDAGLRAPSKDGPAAMSILSPFLEVDGQPESRLVRRRVAVVQGDVGVSEAQDGGKQNKSASKGKDPRKNGARHKNARGGGGGGGGAGRVATRNNRKPPAKKKNVKSSKKGAKG